MTDDTATMRFRNCLFLFQSTPRGTYSAFSLVGLYVGISNDDTVHTGLTSVWFHDNLNALAAHLSTRPNLRTIVGFQSFEQLQLALLCPVLPNFIGDSTKPVFFHRDSETGRAAGIDPVTLELNGV